MVSRSPLVPAAHTKAVGILLAGGYSRRFGTDKLLALLPDSTPIAVAAARALRDGMTLALGEGVQIVAVMRPEQNELANLLYGEGITVLASDAVRRGMGASLAAAVTATADAQGWLVALADMPFVKPKTVAAVARALTAENKIAAPAINGRRGHPVGFAASHGAALATLDGDEGARRLLAENEVTLIACDDAGILRDVDTPGDLCQR